MYPTKILEMIFVFAGLMTCVGCFTGIVITALKRKSPAALPSREIEMRLADITERLARIENTFEATAIEVERISEAQRRRRTDARQGRRARRQLAVGPVLRGLRFPPT